ncbi:MAG TPA: VanW family protein, partial [Polyangiaceae bacterium LLY-WYZ-15_(1-7)]|nr:VanW family protein [Polyangiaceae bacterium LLY-WYZ-15_(1-7)]
LGPAASRPANANGAPAVRVGDRPVDLHGDLAAQAAALAERLLDTPVQVDVLGRPVERSWRELGARVDVERLEGWLQQAADPSSPMREAAGARLPLRLPVEVDPAGVMPWLRELKREIDRPAKDATLDPETGAVVPEQEGRVVDAWGTLEALDAALRAGEDQLAVVIERRPARRTRAELEGVDVSTVLGTFQTPYNGSGDAADRTHNLRVAARKVDGLVLMPGEVFDFNEVVGERSLANGFKPAPVIAGGELVDGVGGGACQIAGTLHAAAFFGGLEIVERNPHSRPSSYIKLGLDAAVAWPNLNFRFRNDRSFPVMVRLVVEGGWVRGEIRGAARTDQVSFVRRIDEAIPYEERENEDPRLPAGVRVLAQRGVPGFRVTVWRIRRDPETNQARSTRDEVSYPPTTQIWRVGTGAPAPSGYEPPEGDTHGEYRADEYLESTQGPGIEGTETVRRAGRTGSPGWTVRAGMPPVEEPDAE